jgi:hypothetical protein
MGVMIVMHVVVLGIVFVLVLMFRAVGMSVLVRMTHVILGFLVRVRVHGPVGMAVFFFRLVFHSAAFSLGGAISLVAATPGFGRPYRLAGRSISGWYRLPLHRGHSTRTRYSFEHGRR